MTIAAKPVDDMLQVKRYPVLFPLSAYTYPESARIERAHIDSDYIHVELVDGRILSIPLRWIPSVHRAAPAEREKFEINRSRTMLVWDPDHCAINDELSLADYLGPIQR